MNIRLQASNLLYRPRDMFNSEARQVFLVAAAVCPCCVLATIDTLQIVAKLIQYLHKRALHLKIGRNIKEEMH
jgi:hypothetical protein